MQLHKEIMKTVANIHNYHTLKNKPPTNISTCSSHSKDAPPLNVRCKINEVNYDGTISNYFSYVENNTNFSKGALADQRKALHSENYKEIHQEIINL